MQHPTPIAIIGGSGKAGLYLVNHFIQQQRPIRVLLRHPEAFPLKSPAMDIIQGDVRNATEVAQLLKGCSALLSTLGQPKDSTEPIFPIATRILLKALQEAGIRRYVNVTGLSIDVPGDQKSERTAQLSMMMRQMFPAIIAAKQEEHALLQQSTIDWTLLRLPTILQTKERFPTSISLQDCKGEKISTSDLAHFMEAQLTDTRYLRQAPFFYNL